MQKTRARQFSFRFPFSDVRAPKEKTMDWNTHTALYFLSFISPRSFLSPAAAAALFLPDKIRTHQP